MNEGNNEIIELTEEIRTEKEKEYKSGADIKKSFNKRNSLSATNNKQKSADSFYQLFSLPGIKMTDKAKKKLIENKKREMNANK